MGYIISIARNSFNPNTFKFIEDGWSIQNDETDMRSVALMDLDLTKVQFVTMLYNDELHISGEEKLKRLKASGHIRLDADIFLTLWENQDLIPEWWKENVNGSTRFIYFDGTVLLDSDGGRYVLCLYWHWGKWKCNAHWLENPWQGHRLSAVFTS